MVFNLVYLFFLFGCGVICGRMTEELSFRLVCCVVLCFFGYVSVLCFFVSIVYVPYLGLLCVRGLRCCVGIF